MILPLRDPRARLVDARGVEVVASSPAAVAALDVAVEAFAGHRADLFATIDAALALDPLLVRAHVLRAMAVRLSARNDDVALARSSVDAARRSMEARGGTGGEALLVSAMDAWCGHDADRAVDELEAALGLAPTDLFALKASHALQFMLGRSRAMRRSLERALPAWSGQGLRGEGAVLGCHAFTLAETGDLALAERVGREACEREDNPWSLHAVAHVLHMRGETALGAAWLEAGEHVLEGVGSLAAHVRWHAAVFALNAGHEHLALDAYDRFLAARLAPDYRDFVNAASLLVRLEHVGIDVGTRWEPLADVAEERGLDHGIAFADSHYALALARAGRLQALARHLSTLRAAAERTGGAEGTTLREVGVPIVEAFAAERTGPFEAARRMRRLEPSLPRLGGSIAQREMYTILADGWESAPSITEVRPARTRAGVP